eukprot:Rhum_TRINITY_DN19715_c0_g1::Rhum_TRINITY_DN19715_c0_g1_i1::g.170472::m.170472
MKVPAVTAAFSGSLAEREEVIFNDRVTGREVCIGLAFGCGLSVKHTQRSEPATVVRQLLYTPVGFGIGKRFGHVGHELEAPGLAHKLHLPFSGGNALLHKLQRMANVSSVSHNLPAVVPGNLDPATDGRPGSGPASRRRLPPSFCKHLAATASSPSPPPQQQASQRAPFGAPEA